MNKIGMVFGIAVVATLAGCKDPDYNRNTATDSQNEVKAVDTTPAAPIQDVGVADVPKAKCTCPPGTKHTSPCTCGLADCKCVVVAKQVVKADLSKPVEPEYTVYIVQNGDYLAKISKKYNVTINSIKRLNPSIKNDVIWVGQKLKLPGKVDVGMQEAPKKAVAAASVGGATKKAAAAYTGATKDYVVKNGDTLGAIAYGNGITIRQLKALNGLSSDSLKIGQTLKIPAEKVEKKAVAKSAADAKKSVAKPVAKVQSAEAEAPKQPVAEATSAEGAVSTASGLETAPVAVPAVPQAAETPAAAEKAEAAKAEAAAPATMTYVVQEGDDMAGVSISWGVSAADIRQLNNMAEGDKLTPGQIIKLPADAQR